MALPERVPGFVVEGGRAVGHDLPSLDSREVLGPWRAALGPRGPLFVRLEADDPAAIAHVQRLSRLGELWLDTPLRSVEDALDLLVAGAARLVVPFAGPATEPGDGDEEGMLEAVGPSAIVVWDGQTPWADVQAFALLHGVPVLAGREPPSDAACDAYVAEGRDATLALRRVASAPEPSPEAQPAPGETAATAPVAETGGAEGGAA